jgi:hypothetical protein
VVVAIVVVGATVVVDGGTVVVVDVLVGVSEIGGGVSPSSSSARIVPVANAARPSPPMAPALYTQLVNRVGRIAHLPFRPTACPHRSLSLHHTCGDDDEPAVGDR